MLSNLYNAVFYFLWGIGYFIRVTFCPGSFFEVDDLLTYGKQKSFLIPHFKFNQTDSAGSMRYFSYGLEKIPAFASCQKMNILLERDRWFSKAIPCCFTGLVSDRKDSSTMSHLVDIDGFLGNRKCGSGETWLEFNQFHPNSPGKGVFTIDFIEDGLQDVFCGFLHLNFSFIKKISSAMDLFS
jgi:hypothetical protein